MRHAEIVAVLFFCSAVTAGGEQHTHEVTARELDTPWSVAEEYFNNPVLWPEIYASNQLPIVDPGVFVPGKKLQLPTSYLHFTPQKADVLDYENDAQWSIDPQNGDWQSISYFSHDGQNFAVRTGESSRLKLQFQNAGVVEIFSNSRVDFKLRTNTPEIKLWKGMLLLRGKTFPLKTSSAKISPKQNSTLLLARIRPDDSTAIRVDEGLAEIIGDNAGKASTLGKGQAMLAKQHAKADAAIVVPDIEGLSLARQPAKPREEVAAPTNWTAFRIQISRNEGFKFFERDQKFSRAQGIHPEAERNYKLPDGVYYQRVSYFDEAGKESKFFPLPRLVVNTHNPELQILSPPEGYTTSSNLLQVEGQTRTGVIVTINNYPVEVLPDGKFRWAVLLTQKGEVVIHVVAKDLQNNQTILERTIEFLGK